MDHISNYEYANQQLDRYLEPGKWSDKGIDSKEINQFVDKLKENISDNKNEGLNRKLQDFKTRIDKELGSEGLNLSSEVSEIAKGIFTPSNAGEDFFSSLPEELVSKIFDHLPEQVPDKRRPKHTKEISNQTVIDQVSKKWEELTPAARKRWVESVGSENISLLQLFGWKGFDKALKFIVDTELKDLNFENMTVTDQNLEDLFQKCNTINSLKVESYNLTKFPTKDIHLQVLQILGSSITDLPSNYKSLKHLSLQNCDNLPTLPESYGKTLVELHIVQCGNFKTIPDSYKKLETLVIATNPKLHSIPVDCENMKEYVFQTCKKLTMAVPYQKISYSDYLQQVKLRA